MTGGPGLAGRRVLVTGGLGFIGSNLVHRCVELGAEVTVLDNLDPRCGGNAANLAGVEGQVRVVHADIRDDGAAGAAVRDSDIVFACAAFTSHARSMEDPRHVMDVNCGGTVVLLEAARREHGRVRMVHVGTSTQIGRMITEPITELHPEFPLDMYSASKTASEKLVLVYGDAHGVPVTVVRLANVYGPRANIRNPDFGFLNYFVGLALQGKPLTVYGAGDQLRNVAYVGDAVEALVRASTSDAAIRQVVFAVSDEHLTVRALAETIARELGGPGVTSIPWPADRRAIEAGGVVIDGARARELLGWHATTSLRDGLAATKAFYAPRLSAYAGAGA
jgi:UDP-glucose 4-epimerase